MIRRSTLLFACGAFLLLPTITFAQTWNGAGDGTTWEDPNNWVGGALPTGNTFIGNFATPINLSTSQNIGELEIVGDNTTGTAVVNHTAGTLNTGGNWNKVGIDAGNDGTLNLSGTAVNTGSNVLFVGRFGTGLVDLSGGSSYDHGGDLNVGTEVGGNGTINLSDTANLATGNQVNLGNNGTGTINIADGATFNAQNFNSANGAGGTAVVNQTGGTITTNSWTAIGQGATGAATYNHSGGVLNASVADDEFLTIGENGAGTYNASGNAVINVASDNTASGGVKSGGVIIGRDFNSTDSVGLLVMNGSTIDFQTNDLRLGTSSDNPGGEGVGNDGMATISWVADTNGANGGLSTIFSSDNTEFGVNSFLDVDLTAHSLFASYDAAGTIASQILLIDNVNPVAGAAGTFNGLSEGSLVSIGGGKTGTISYFGGDGNDVVINLLSTAIPEPTAATILALAGMGMMTRRRRN